MSCFNRFSYPASCIFRVRFASGNPSLLFPRRAFHESTLVTGNVSNRLHRRPDKVFKVFVNYNSSSNFLRKLQRSFSSDSQEGNNDFEEIINSSSNSTMKVLNVAEKNDAAKRIAHLLANGQVNMRHGCSTYNKLYEFQFNFRGQNCLMTMTSVSGHLLNYEFTSEYRKWYSCDPVELFDAPVAKTCQDTMKDVKRQLEQQAPYAQVLIIWTDCDREGENIGYEVINVCKAVNPRLEVLRAKFSEITKPSVFNAMNRLIQPDKRVSDAVDVRQELDLRIGAAFTRFQTLRLTKKFPTLADRLISYGSCQFPTLGFVVERYKAIQDFVREDFWKIDVSHKVDDFLVNFSWARVRLFNQLAVQTIFEACLDEPTARVTKVQSKPKSKYRPVALDTIEFEKLASRKLRIGAKEAMQIAEQLYTKGIISYPRTETNIFPPSLNLGNLVQEQTGSNQWGGFATRILQQQGGPTPRNGKKSDQAHPPIHPTKFDNLAGLSDKHKRVYELIVRHFLACCSKDAIGKETIVEIDIAGEKFIANGLIVIERNYLEVYIYDKWSDKEIPDFHDGQTFRPTKIEMTDGKTSPPNLLTEADLIALMEKHGIGTDATHAEHIETIKQRLYVGLQGNFFVPGKLGMGLVEGYDAMGFEMSKPHLRAQLESDLQKICEGRRRPNEVLREQVQRYKEVFIQACDQVVRLDEALSRLLNDEDGGQGAGGDGGGGGGPRGGGGGGGGPRGGGVPRGGGGRPNNGPNWRGGNDDDDDDDDDDGDDGGNNAPARGTRNIPVRNTVSQYQRPPPPTSRPTSRDADNQISASEEPLCSCGTVPDILTVKKEGPTCGRQFYKCKDCGYFLWKDDHQPNLNRQNTNFRNQNNAGNTFARSFTAPSNQRNQSNSRTQSTQSTRNNFSNPDSNNGIPMCSCNLTASSYTVKKEGVNKGRKFYGCAKPYGSDDSRCDFFSWDDDGGGQQQSNTRNAQPPTPRRTNNNKNRGGTQGTKRARRCGICHQEGHTRRNCPVAGGDEDDEEEMEYY